MTLALKLIIIFSTVGLLDTIYLTYAKLAKKDVYCLFFPKEWCLKVQYSTYSKTLGIPNSFAGLAMYILILGLIYFFLQGSAPFAWIQGIIAFGFLFSLYFTYIQAFVLRAFCTWCVVSAINFTVMAIAAFLL